MSHLTPEQLEDILQGRAEAPEHLDGCSWCQARLEEERALAERVHRAFSALHAGAGLTDRIRAQIAAGRPADAAGASRRIVALRVSRRLWPGLAVAAAILIVALPRCFRLDLGPRVTAAQTALAGIHFANLKSLESSMSDDDSGRHCRCREGKLGGGMTMPCCERGLCKCGCQMRDFQGRMVESCVIEQPDGPPISVVVIPESPQALGMTLAKTTTATGQAVWQASCEHCNMASVPMGEASCCVMGDVPQENLVAVLNAMGQ